MSDDDVLPEPQFEWAGATRVPAGSTYGPYVTQYWEFIWCLEGGAEVTSEGLNFRLDRGALQLTEPGVRNYYRWHPQEATTYGYAIFRMSDDLPDRPRWRPGGTDDVIVTLLNHLRWLDTIQPSGWRTSARVVLAYALRAFVSGASATRMATDRPLPGAINRALIAVRERWETEGVSEPRLTQLASAAGVTPEYLCRLFTRHFALGPVSTIRMLRLHRAAELLSSTNLSVAEIARRLGFSSEFHFSRAFRKLAGQAPSRFRQDRAARLEFSVPLRQLSRQLPL